ncbi:DUF5691 domain-containing protein [Gordonia rhizosphera]|uniref:Uncharacterized protein n=1 Tax=Gordonia rhizosphera NBRC 16068 TaxID=1108045 RepID=K6V9Y3_9ACTN|nr:DUF5691 domain-containing protein [Gordonia rhizosphera]GAB93028.1 hypothetical protein GORHZ_202_00170 [Gordonia rhizosphera NBRC 16068]
MSTWEDTVSAALVGVRTRPVTTDEVDPVIGAHLPTDFTDPVVTTLTIAALTAVAHQSVGPNTVAAEPIPPAPDDSRPPMPELAATYVHRALELTPRLADWCLSLLARSTFQPPPALLPALLARTARDVAIRETAARIVGPRGQWLAQYAPELGAVLPDTTSTSGTALPDDSTWTHGQPGERRDYLAALRERDPQAALDLLVQTWGAETGDDRELLITALRNNLSTRDEAFLESALDDRRKGVRTAAASLLDGVVGSALQDRLFHAAVACVRLAQTRSRGQRIAITLPSNPDAAFARDGIVLKAPRGVGIGAFVLSQLVSRVPPNRWEAHFGMSPDAIVAAVDPAETEFVAALCAATVTHRDQRWANALLKHPAASPAILDVADEGHIVDAFATLPGPLKLAALRAHPGPWRDTLCRSAVRMIQAELSGSRFITPNAVQIISLMSTGLPATDDWRQRVDAMRDSAPTATTQFATLSEALRIRSVLEKELT